MLDKHFIVKQPIGNLPVEEFQVHRTPWHMSFHLRCRMRKCTENKEYYTDVCMSQIELI